MTSHSAAWSRPRPATQPPAPPAPLIAPTGSPGLDGAIDAINTTAAPFMSAPPPEQGAAGWVAQGLGGVLGIVGAPQQIIDQAFAGFTAPIAALFPAMPAVTLLGMHVGMPHAHAHPPSLIPPAPPVPLPSIGMLVGSGAVSVLGCGLPLARAGDIGISVTCGSLAPPFEVFTGSSNVFVGGARAARILDITKHCNPTSMGPFAIAMSAAGVVAGAAGAIATGQAAAAAQAAADAAVLAIKLLCGKDPGIPPGIGALIGPPAPTVMIGGFPCPPIGDMVIGGLMKGLKALANAAKKLRSSRRANGHCGDGSHPIYLVTGENFDQFVDFDSGRFFTWKRHYTTARAHADGPLGFGFRHFYQRTLDVRLHQATFTDWDGVALEFPKFPRGERLVRAHGYRLERVDRNHYELATRGQPTLVFAGDMFAGPLPLVGLRDEGGDLQLIYDARGRLVEIHDRPRSESGDVRRYRITYDAADHMTSIVEVDGNLVRVHARYSDRGELVQVIDACHGAWQYEYDEDHRWTKQIDPREYAYSFEYDDQGRCVAARGQDGLWAATVEYRPEEGLTRYTEGHDATWALHYDKDGFIHTIVNPHGGKTLRERDAEGRILREVDPGGRTLTWLYDADDCHYARRDRFGYLHPTELEQPKLGDPFARTLPSDALGWYFGGLVARSPAALLGASGLLLDEIPSPLQERATAVFRRRGSVTSVDPRVEHDALGRRLRETDALGRTRTWQYDAAGNLVAARDRDGRVETWTTTSWNLVGEHRDPLGHTIYHRWSTLEQLVGLTDPAGNTTHWNYDASERLVEVWRGDRLREHYEYDIEDRFVAKYDGEGRLLFRNAEFYPNQFVRRRELADGREHRFDYDARGRIVEASTEACEVRLAFDVHDRRALDLRDGQGLVRTHGQGGRTHTRLFDRFEIAQTGATIVAPNGDAIHIRHFDDGVVLREASNGTREWLQFDHEGRLEARLATTLERGEPRAWTTRYTYSPEGDLLSESDSARGITHHRLDDAHRLVEMSLPSGERLAYEYDPANNLIAKPGLGRLEIGPHNLALASEAEFFEYDARDRLARRHHRDGGETRYHYDTFDQLVRVDTPRGTWTAAYDAIGRRLWADLDGARREFWWDGDRLAAEQREDGTLRIYIYAGHDALCPIAFVDHADRHADPHEGDLYHVFGGPTGMPLRIEGRHGKVVWSARHVDAYGALFVDPSATLAYDLRWPGHYFDAATGLHCNRYRYYDPRLGRYLSSDPIGYRGSEVNLYAYCPNPLVQVDLLGLTHPGDTDGAPGSQKNTSGDVDGQERPPTREEKLRRLQDERQRRLESDQHKKIVDENRKARDSGEFDRKLDADDRAYINDERALSRASDPDKKLSDKRPGSPIDESKAMEHAENTGQLTPPVDRSVRPGADVKTGTGSDETHHSMKGISNHDHEGSMARSRKEINNMATLRQRGDTPHGVIIDLRHSPDPATDRAALQAHADSVNQGLVNDGKAPISVQFIVP